MLRDLSTVCTVLDLWWIAITLNVVTTEGSLFTLLTVHFSGLEMQGDSPQIQTIEHLLSGVAAFPLESLSP